MAPRKAEERFAFWAKLLGTLGLLFILLLIVAAVTDNEIVIGIWALDFIAMIIAFPIFGILWLMGGFKSPQTDTSRATAIPQAQGDYTASPSRSTEYTVLDIIKEIGIGLGVSIAKVDLPSPEGRNSILVWHDDEQDLYITEDEDECQNAFVSAAIRFDGRDAECLSSIPESKHKALLYSLMSGDTGSSLQYEGDILKGIDLSHRVTGHASRTVLTRRLTKAIDDLRETTERVRSKYVTLASDVRSKSKGPDMYA